MKKVNDALRNANAELLKHQAAVCFIVLLVTAVIILLPKMDRLENSIRAKDDELSAERSKHQNSVTMYVSQLRDLRIEYDDKIKEYENLMDVKVALDQEIATYRSLLEEEEDRLGHICN